MANFQHLPNYIRKKMLQHPQRERSSTKPCQLIFEAVGIFGLGKISEPYATDGGCLVASVLCLSGEQYQGWKRFAEFVGGELVIDKIDARSNELRIRLVPPAGLTVDGLLPMALKEDIREQQQ